MKTFVGLLYGGAGMVLLGFGVGSQFGCVPPLDQQMVTTSIYFILGILGLQIASETLS